MVRYKCSSCGEKFAKWKLCYSHLLDVHPGMFHPPVRPEEFMIMSKQDAQPALPPWRELTDGGGETTGTTGKFHPPVRPEEFQITSNQREEPTVPPWREPSDRGGQTTGAPKGKSQGKGKCKDRASSADVGKGKGDGKCVGKRAGKNKGVDLNTIDKIEVGRFIKTCLSGSTFASDRDRLMHLKGELQSNFGISISNFKSIFGVKVDEFVSTLQLDDMAGGSEAEGGELKGIWEEPEDESEHGTIEHSVNDSAPTQAMASVVGSTNMLSRKERQKETKRKKKQEEWEHLVKTNPAAAEHSVNDSAPTQAMASVAGSTNMLSRKEMQKEMKRKKNQEEWEHLVKTNPAAAFDRQLKRRVDKKAFRQADVGTGWLRGGSVDAVNADAHDAADGHASDDANLAFHKGEVVECFWQEDVWLQAQITNIFTHGGFMITWQEDGSRSEVPADYVRKLQDS